LRWNALLNPPRIPHSLERGSHTGTRCASLTFVLPKEVPPVNVTLNVTSPTGRAVPTREVRSQGDPEEHAAPTGGESHLTLASVAFTLI